MCYVCRWVLLLAYPNENRNTFYAEVATPPFSRREDFVEIVIAWEKVHNDNDAGQVRFKEFSAAYEKKLESCIADSFVVTESMGSLWPLAVYESHFKKKPPATAKISSVTHKGRKVVGILQSADMGWAPGVLELKSSTTASLTLGVDLGSSNDELRQGQFEDLRKSQLSEMRVEMGEQEDGTYALKRKATALLPSFTESDDEDPILPVSLRTSARRLWGVFNHTPNITQCFCNRQSWIWHEAAHP